MAGIKELKTRIRSIGSTRKITRAMQLVSAAKMRKAQNATLQSRSYASLAWGMIGSLGATHYPHLTSPLKGEEYAVLPSPQGGGVGRGEKIGVILLTSNRGLVGSLNTNLMGKLKDINPDAKVGADGSNGKNEGIDRTNKTDRADETNTETIAEIVSYGKKGQILAARLKKNIVADFPKMDRTISIEDIYPIAKFVSDAYNTGKYKKIVIVYNHFVSTLQQKPTVKQLLPFANDSTSPQSSPRQERRGDAGPSPLARGDLTNAASDREIETANFLFEPSPQTVINHLIPRIIESQIYQAILESDASEHSARMVMMKNATEAAGDLISDLTLTFNQLRQNKITTELAEITAGKIALE